MADVLSGYTYYRNFNVTVKSKQQKRLTFNVREINFWSRLCTSYLNLLNTIMLRDFWEWLLKTQKPFSLQLFSTLDSFIHSQKSLHNLFSEIRIICTQDFWFSSDGKESACCAGDPGSIPGSGRSPGEGNGNPSSTLAWRIPWTEQPDGLQSMGLQRVGLDGVTNTTQQCTGNTVFSCFFF